jgi:hypothetical protein
MTGPWLLSFPWEKKERKEEESRRRQVGHLPTYILIGVNTYRLLHGVPVGVISRRRTGGHVLPFLLTLSTRFCTRYSVESSICSLAYENHSAFLSHRVQCTYQGSQIGEQINLTDVEELRWIVWTGSYRAFSAAFTTRKL